MRDTKDGVNFNDVYKYILIHKLKTAISYVNVFSQNISFSTFGT